MHTKPQTQESQRPPSRINTKTNRASKHIIIKLLQIRDKEKILKSSRRQKKDTLYTEDPR